MKIIRYLLIGIVAIVFLKGCLNGYLSNSEERSKKKTTAAVNTENWTYDIDEVGIDKTKSIYAINRSINSLDLKFPYNGSNHGSLVIRKMKNKIEILLSIDKGQIIGEIYNIKGKIKFDNSNSFSFTANKSNDGSSNIVFIKNPSAILEKIRKSKKMLVEVELYNNGIQVIEFNIDGFKLEKLS